MKLLILLLALNAGAATVPARKKAKAVQVKKAKCVKYKWDALRYHKELCK